MRCCLFLMTLPLYLSANVCDPLMCFDRQGNCIKITVKETNQSVVLEATPFIKDQGWLEPKTLSDNTRMVLSKPLFQLNDQDMLAIAWQSLDSENNAYLEVAVYTPTSGWEATEILSETLEYLNPGVYSIHLDRTGAPFITWESCFSSSPSRYLRTAYFANSKWITPTTTLLN